MKKNRPATMVSILCAVSDKERLTELLYRETSTLGVRIREVDRECLAREVVRVETKFGAIDVKIARSGSEIVNVMPEYEQVKAAARENGVSFLDVRDAVLNQVREGKKSVSPEV